MNPGIQLEPPDRDWSAPNSGRAAAVLIALARDEAGWSILYVRRPDLARDRHRRQVAFPGGRFEPEDKLPIDTALREAHEEVGIPPASVTVIGTLPAHSVITGYTIEPVVGIVRRHQPLHLAPTEVQRAFWVKVDDLLDQRNMRWGPVPRDWGGIPGLPFPHWRVAEEVVWGATERITQALLGRWAIRHRGRIEGR